MTGAFMSTTNNWAWSARMPFGAFFCNLSFPEDSVPPGEPACSFQSRTTNVRRSRRGVNMFKGVTVSREYGSGGGIIARTVAEELR